MAINISYTGTYLTLTQEELGRLNRVQKQEAKDSIIAKKHKLSVFNQFLL
jgi:hypothetical protein